MKYVKIVAEIELPIGGDVKYTIGETDNTLEVTVWKHALMLNFQALLYAAIDSGNLNVIEMIRKSIYVQ